ncbi:MAG TPA: hypothetical protein VES95_06460 [Dermatophilaceae bacterium]|nr:hypothetical protein [Dermatophilaceae bacterium]
MTETPSTDLAPGMLAFVAFLALAIALWLLMRNMNARLRRMSYARRAELEREEQQGARPGEGGDPASPAAGGPPPAEGPPGRTAP